MPDSSEATVRELRAALIAAGLRVCAARDELSALDAVAGDGDLGATLTRGFTNVNEALRTVDSDDAGALFTKAGTEMATKAPSTIGALLATAFLRAGNTVTGQHAINGEDASLLLEAASKGVAERGGASPGQRTILDAMSSASAAAAAAAGNGATTQEVFTAAAAGAHAGAEATAEMEPQHGRAGWIPDRARGSKDAGAAAWAEFLSGLADGLNAELAGVDAGAIT